MVGKDLPAGGGYTIDAPVVFQSQPCTIFCSNKNQTKECRLYAHIFPRCVHMSCREMA